MVRASVEWTKICSAGTSSAAEDQGNLGKPATPLTRENFARLLRANAPLYSYVAMQHNRKTLTLRASAPPANLSAEDRGELVREAISRGLCVRAIYNRAAVRIAPHILYSRHGDLFLDGVVADRDGVPPREVKMSTFKLAGLNGLALTRRAIEFALPLDLQDAKYAETVTAIGSARSPQKLVSL